MSAADEAYEAARAEIARVKAWGATVLRLDREPFRALNSLPPEIADLDALRTLNLNNTHVSDISQLNNLTGIQTLSLNHTQISDIAPLRGMTKLQEIWLEHTKVMDFRPLLSLQSLNAVFLRDSAGALRDTELEQLTASTGQHKRTRKTLEYLATLPPWPEPLPYENPGPPRSDPLGDSQDPDIPPSVPAPLQVVEIDGLLRPAAPGDSLDADGHLLAIQGWEALRDYLSDLADQRARIGNNMPRLGKALARLDVSLGETYDAINPVAVGTQGNRVIRLARNAPDMLLEEDADDIAEFAAALALFLERFPDWRAYREAARVHPPDPEAVQSSLPEIEAFAEALEEISAISPEIPDSLEQQAEAVREDPEDEIAVAGIVASLRNVASALGHFALSTWRIAKREGADIGKQTWGITKKGVAATAATGLSSLPAAAWDIYFNNAKLLQSLAAKFPEQLDWLARLLQAMGL